MNFHLSILDSSKANAREQLLSFLVIYVNFPSPFVKWRQKFCSASLLVRITINKTEKKRKISILSEFFILDIFPASGVYNTLNYCLGRVFKQKYT